MSKKYIFSYLIFLITAVSFTQCSSETTAKKEVSDATTELIEETAKAKVQDASKVAEETVEKVEEPIPTLTSVKEEAKAEDVVEKKEKVAEKKKKKRAKAKFGSTLYSFGEIKQGDIVKHDFKFKNIGNAPLVIRKVDVSCGCTFPSYPFIPIKPGKEGTIAVTYDSKNKIGRQKPTITVVTNGRPHTFKLNLEGTVR